MLKVVVMGTELVLELCNHDVVCMATSFLDTDMLQAVVSNVCLCGILSATLRMSTAVNRDTCSTYLTRGS